VQTRAINIAGVQMGGGHPLCLVAGPCVIESEEACFEAARQVQQVAIAACIPLIFKSSFDKANRTSVTSYRGPGLKEGLRILAAIKRELALPVLTDVHDIAQAEAAAEVVDVIQIPAFLCRQTDLLTAAGKTGKPVNVKKGQFLAPGDMRNVVEKIRATDNDDIILTERGTSFGYNYLVNDMRALPAMRMLGYPVLYDATHSVQVPGGMGTRSGGERQFIPALSRAAVAAGVDGIFMEVHPDPEKALSDGTNMLRITDLVPLLHVLQQIDHAVREAVAGERMTETSRFSTGRTLINPAPKL
jgi:2-dehydro-3-deoxyphosphooctonate aldolase (KDO 8-P synthase)